MLSEHLHDSIPIFLLPFTITVILHSCPVKTFKRKSTPPWLDNKIKQLLKKKETARRKAKKTAQLNIHKKYRALRRQAKKRIAEKRNEWFQGLPNLLKSTAKCSGFLSSLQQNNLVSLAK